jgi:2-oxoisovalerate dehydrogenase E2 component (dihydrolipoyl transacylase)
MGRYVMRLADLGEGTTEAEIVAWHVVPGDVIREEDPLVDVMTEKATVEIPAPVSGTVIELGGAVGEKRPVGSELATIEVAGEGGNTLAAGAPLAAPSGASAAAVQPPAEGAVVAPSSLSAAGPRTAARRTGGERTLAAPAVRRRAADLGIELALVTSTGPGGRVTQDDLEAYAAAHPPTATPGARPLLHREGVEDIVLLGLRRTIAERLQEAARRIPHFTYIEEVDVTAVEALRRHLNDAPDQAQGRPHLTLLPFLMRALVKAIAEHPEVNARFDDEAGILHRHNAVHVGLATQTEAGLMVPVVRHAEALDLWRAAAEIARLAEAARDGRISLDELTGSTITITSLGALGGLASTPLVNRPEVAIVGVNRITRRPVIDGGQMVARSMMNLSSSFDHRIVDGWQAARFVQRIKAFLEQPATLFIG